MTIYKKSAYLSVAILATHVHASTCPDALTNGVCEADANGLANNTGSFPVGIVIDTDMRNEMQKEVFGNNHACVGDDSIDCMPGISSAELRTVLQGKVLTWFYLTSSGGTSVDASGSKLSVCGLSTSLATGVAAINFSNSSINTGETDISAVETCMMPFVPSKCSDTRKFGVLPTTSSASHFKFIKLDNIAPTLAEHISGNYNLVANYSGSDDLAVLDGATSTQGAPTKSSGGVLNSEAACVIAQGVPALVPDTP